MECSWALKLTATARERKGFTSEEDCTQKFISKIEKEIQRLEDHRKNAQHRPKWQPETDPEAPTAEELLKCAIPDSEVTDRLLRYEVSIERIFDRILIQLERLQRMREGQKTFEIVHQTTTSE
jgi:hypothetical protein